MTFPNDFVWGTATSSIQVEGSPAGDGKGKNIWDAYSHDTDRIRENHNPDIACDHYNRYKEDVEIMKKIGVHAYRFSIDMYGQNIYNGWVVKMGDDGKTASIPRDAGYPATASGWSITPECLY